MVAEVRVNDPVVFGAIRRSDSAEQRKRSQASQATTRLLERVCTLQDTVLLEE